MRRTKFFSVLSALALFATVSAPAFADSPHFLSASASINSNGALVCTFKEAGLGNTVATETVTCTADGSATYACINGGSNHPKAANKETVNGPVSGSGDFPVRNGSVTGSTPPAGPPSAGSFSCPSGQTLSGATNVSYTNIQLTGAGVTVSLGSLP